MLPLLIPENEMWDSEKEEFVSGPAVTLQLEHSLISVSKWEAKWHKSFLSSTEFTADEFRDYVKCMTINRVQDDSIYDRLTTAHEKLIRAYIENKMTATTVKHDPRQRSRNRIITSEQIYGWMVQYGIPFDPCEKWHLNRLMMLIDVCGAQQSGGTKMSAKERGEWMRAQHAKRSGGKHK